MKKLLVSSCLSLLLLSFLASPAKAQHQPAKQLRHIVMITFKEGASRNQIKEVDDSFRNLANKLKVVKSYETGTTLSNDQPKTITHVYSFSFASEEDLASCGASAEHQQHIKIGQSIIERGQAIDYWVDQ